MLSTLPLFYIAQSVNSDDRRARFQGLRVIMLPKELRAITNVNSFKAHIKTYLFRTLYWRAILHSVLTCMHMYSFYCYFF